jgi:methyltransferase (TIGR00027 family)
MDEPGGRLPAVGVTGVGVAAIRAAESSRPDRLFDDPFAARFASAAGWNGTRGDPSRRRHLSAWIAVRTRFLDDVVLDACAGGCRQVVILGAGLDARSFRLRWPLGTNVWELDLPSVLEFKERVVRSEGWQPSCRRRTVAVDLSGPWGQALVDGGLDTEAPVAWLAEGLLAYLTEEIGDRIVSVAAELSVPGSRLGLTVASPERLRAWRRAHPDGRAGPGDYVALWRSTGPEDPASWLASHGWEAAVYATAERSMAYGRSVDEDGVSGGEKSGAGLVDATRR